MRVSPLLAKIYMCVSFVWDFSKLGCYEQSVATVLGYPTSVDVCVVTNAPEKLGRVFETWEVSSKNLWVCEESWAASADDHFCGGTALSSQLQPQVCWCARGRPRNLAATVFD